MRNLLTNEVRFIILLLLLVVCWIFLKKDPTTEGTSIPKDEVSTTPPKTSFSPPLIDDLSKHYKCNNNSSWDNNINFKVTICGNNNTLVFPLPSTTLGTVVVQILSQDYQWAFNSYSKLENIKDDFKNFWTKKEMNQRYAQYILGKSRYLIAVGTASQEGDKDANSSLAYNRLVEIRKHTQSVTHILI